MDGAVDVDKTLDEFLSELETAGIDKIIDLKEKQFEEWKAQQ